MFGISKSFKFEILTISLVQQICYYQSYSTVMDLIQHPSQIRQVDYLWNYSAYSISFWVYVWAALVNQPRCCFNFKKDAYFYIR